MAKLPKVPVEEMEDWALPESQGVEQLDRKINMAGSVVVARYGKPCKCPWACGHADPNPAIGRTLNKGGGIAFEKACEKCGQIILYLVHSENGDEGRRITVQAKASSLNHGRKKKPHEKASHAGRVH